jgi:hypothetical protein
MITKRAGFPTRQLPMALCSIAAPAYLARSDLYIIGTEKKVLAVSTRAANSIVAAFTGSAGQTESVSSCPCPISSAHQHVWRFAAGGEDGVVRVYDWNLEIAARDVASSCAIAAEIKMPHPVSCVSFSPHGALLYVGLDKHPQKGYANTQSSSAKAASDADNARSLLVSTASWQVVACAERGRRAFPDQAVWTDGIIIVRDDADALSFLQVDSQHDGAVSLNEMSDAAARSFLTVAASPLVKDSKCKSVAVSTDGRLLSVLTGEEFKMKLVTLDRALEAVIAVSVSSSGRYSGAVGGGDQKALPTLESITFTSTQTLLCVGMNGSLLLYSPLLGRQLASTTPFAAKDSLVAVAADGSQCLCFQESFDIHVAIGRMS